MDPGVENASAHIPKHAQQFPGAFLFDGSNDYSADKRDFVTDVTQELAAKAVSQKDPIFP